MRINEEKMYTMYLTVSEFNLMYPLTNEVPYGYRVVNEEYVLTLTEDMIDDIQDKLDYAAYVEEYEECNRFKANEIKDLMNNIYYELR